MSSHVAFIRGINVGRRKRVAMEALREAFESLGHDDVTTHLQSGNVLFSARSAAAAGADAIEKRLDEKIGLDARVVLRTRNQLERAVAGSPFQVAEAGGSKLHVVFLSDAPTAKAVAELDPGRSPPDEFAVVGKEIYVVYPNGAGRSKLTADYFGRRLGAHATARNWNTVTKVLALMRA